MLDDGVMEGERGRGGEGRLEEERSVEGDALRREGVRKTRPLLCVEMFLLSLPVLLFFLLSPHPLLLPLFSLLLYLFPLHLFLLLLLSLPFLPLCIYALECNSFRCLSGAILISDISTVITISDMIIVKMITLTTVNTITGVSVALINTPEGFAINC